MRGSHTASCTDHPRQRRPNLLLMLPEQQPPPSCHGIVPSASRERQPAALELHLLCPDREQEPSAPLAVPALVHHDVGGGQL